MVMYMTDVRSVCWASSLLNPTEAEGSLRSTRLASSWASLGCGSGFWPCTVGRWEHYDESAGGKTGKPGDRRRNLEQAIHIMSLWSCRDQQ